MRTILRKPALYLVVLLVPFLTACFRFGNPLKPEIMEKINDQVIESIEKTIPLPEQVVIKTHIGDDLRFSTGLSLDEVVAFYRATYTTKGYVEEAGSQVLADNASLVFTHDGEKDVLLEVKKNEKGSDVHIRLSD